MKDLEHVVVCHKYSSWVEKASYSRIWKMQIDNNRKIDSEKHTIFSLEIKN